MREGLRSDVRRAAAEADDPAARARPAGAARARGRVRRRRHASSSTRGGDGLTFEKQRVGAGIDGRGRSMPANPTRRLASIRAAATGAASARSAGGPASSLWYGLGVPAAARRSRRCTSWRRPAGRFPTASSSTLLKNGRSPKSPSAIRRSAARCKQPPATARKTQAVHDHARRRSEAHRGARGAEA